MLFRYMVLRIERMSVGSKRDFLFSLGGFEKYMLVCDDCLVEYVDEIGLDF